MGYMNEIPFEAFLILLVIVVIASWLKGEDI